MRLHKTAAEWTKVKPSEVMEGSKAQGQNVLAMALDDIRRMSTEIDRLRLLVDEQIQF